MGDRSVSSFGCSFRQRIGKGSAALRPGAGVEGHVAVVEQDEVALVEIEAVAIRSTAQAKLVPEAAGQ